MADTDAFEIFAYVKAMLGFPVVEVEITDYQLEMFLTNTLQSYSRLIPVIKWYSIPAYAGVQAYEPDASTIGNGITEVMIPRLDPIAPLLLSSGPRLDIFGYRYSYPYRDISELYIDYMYFGIASKILSADFKWTFIDGKIYIAPKPDESFPLTYSAAHSRTIDEVPKADIDWVRNHVLAQTEIAVGRVRRKFNIPGAQSTQMLDGDPLVKEGLRRLELAEQELLARTPDFGPMPA